MRTKTTAIIVFRYDDFSTPSDARMDSRVVEAFASRDLPLLVGVVPYDLEVPLPREKALLLARAPTVEVALHGYAHARNGKWTEFVGLSLAEQQARLRRGCELLHDRFGWQPGTFAPPWNTYDESTLAALSGLGFTCLSAGRDVPEPSEQRLGFLPTTCGLTQLRPALRAAGHHRPSLIIVLFHAYNFQPGRYYLMSLEGLGDLLDEVRTRGDVTVATPERLLRADEDLSAHRLTLNAKIIHRLAGLPRPLRRLYGPSQYLYLSQDDVQRLSLRHRTLILAGSACGATRRLLARARRKPALHQAMRN